MIASHNSLTYLPPRHWWWRIISPWWRCQSLTITEQLRAGVIFFDLRVRFRDGHIQPCHGLVDLDMTEKDFNQILCLLCDLDAHCRIIVERGGFKDAIRVLRLYRHLPCFTEVTIKRGWQTVYIVNDSPITIKDKSKVPLHTDKPWYKQLSTLYQLLIPIKWWAKKHNGTHGDGLTMYDYVEYARPQGLDR